MPLFYPNPSTGLVHICFTQTEQRFIEVFDNKGNKMIDAYCRDLKTQLLLKKNGLYFIKISQTDKTFTEKVIIR